MDRVPGFSRCRYECKLAEKIETQFGAETISAINKIRNCFLVIGFECRRPREKSSHSHCRLARIGRANKKSFVDLRDGAGGPVGAAVVFELRGGGRDNRTAGRAAYRVASARTAHGQQKAGGARPKVDRSGYFDLRPADH